MHCIRFIPRLLMIIGLFIAAPAQAVTELTFWHSMDGELGEALTELTNRFNASQKEYKVVPIYKGSYDETAGAGKAAYLAGKAPDILQVYDLAAANMLYAKRAVKPVYQLLAESHEKLAPDAYVPAASSYYSDAKGRLMGLPFNVSTPVMFYNRDVLIKAGIDPDKPLTTWYDLQAALLAIEDKHAAHCGLTTTWPSWILIENTLAWHSEEFATRNNGFDGLNAQLTFNTRLAIRHVSLLSSWLKSSIFTYAGRRDEGEALFIKGDCAFLTTSSSSYAAIKRNASFKFGVMQMPYYDDINKAPYNSSIGGAGLWAMGGKKPIEYKGIAEFFVYLSQPETQALWHQRTGYLPLSRAAYELTKKQGFYDAEPGIEVSIKQVRHSSHPTAFSRGVRLGDYALVRAILDEELEEVWSLKKPPKQALDDAVRRGNEVLRRFERANR
jgi:sn-glycerol 3-phosphate transport system substrate-binding protein